MSKKICAKDLRANMSTVTEPPSDMWTPPSAECQSLSEHYIIKKIFFEILNIQKGYYVDVGAGDGTAKQTSNTNILRLATDPWDGFGIDSSYNIPKNKIKQYAVTAENIVKIFEENNVPKEFDFLDMDIDGNDYWVLKAIFEAGYKPKVWITEINPGLPIDRPISIIYDSKFKYAGDGYHGMNITAAYRLAIKHGYKLITRCPCNTFFALEDLPIPGIKTDNLTHEQVIEKYNMVTVPYLRRINQLPARKEWEEVEI